MFKGLSMLLLSVASIGAFVTPTAKDNIEINPLKATNGDEVVYKMDFDFKGSDQLFTPELYQQNVFDFKDKDNFVFEKNSTYNVFMDSRYRHGFYFKPLHQYAYTTYINLQLANPDQLVSYVEFDLINPNNSPASLMIDGETYDLKNNETVAVKQFIYKDVVYINGNADDFVVSNIKVHAFNTIDIKANYISHFIEMTNEECANYDKPNAGISDKTWDTLRIGFNKFFDFDCETAFEISTAVPNAQGDELGQMMARYVMICNKYGKFNFLDSEFVNKSLEPHTYMDYTAIVVVSFSAIVLTACAAFAIIKVKKTKANK